MVISPIYNQFFPETDAPSLNWDQFSNYKLKRSFNELTPDFCVTTASTWVDVAQKVALLALQIVIFPWGLYVACQALVGRIVMIVANPAQLQSTLTIEEMRADLQQGFERIQSTCVSREINLEKDGNRYNGLMLADKKNISNGKWFLFAGGNMTTLESVLQNGYSDFREYMDLGYNILFVNGPGVGKSPGWATAERIGEAQELAISYLESAVKAKKIVMAGHSLGGAAIGQGILQHQFKNDVDYFVIRLKTFSRLTDVAQKLFGQFMSALTAWSFSEMDSVEASKKLHQHRINELVVKANLDEIMYGVDLLDAVVDAGIMDYKRGMCVDESHNEIPHNMVINEIQRWERSLEKSV